MTSTTTASSKTSNLTPTVALLASPSRIDAMMNWVVKNAIALSGCNLLASPLELKERLQVFQQLALDDRMLSVKVDTLSDNADDDVVADALVASKILAGQVRGVVCFQDYKVAIPNLDFLIRTCDSRNIPLALNEATADLCLRGVANTRTVYLIFNPVAGQGEGMADLDVIKSILEPTNILHVIITEKDRNVADQVKEIIDIIQSSEDNDTSRAVIVASGGDGTVSVVAGCTMGTGIPFAAIPRGTCNAFSVALGIPTNVEEACNNILFGHVRVIDGGMCNDVPFINLAGVGFEAGLVNNATRELKNTFGNIAYMIGGAQQALQQKPFTCNITIDDQETQSIETDVITVANVAPNSSIFAQGFGEVIPDDGLFEITISMGTNNFEGLEVLASLWISSVVKAPTMSDKILRVRAKSLIVDIVDCDPEQQPKLLLDGEVLQMNPVKFQIVENGLHVITPVPDEKKE